MACSTWPRHWQRRRLRAARPHGRMKTTIPETLMLETTERKVFRSNSRLGDDSVLDGRRALGKAS
jgi:hypothetical protein